jgi:hypothetical protein
MSQTPTAGRTLPSMVRVGLVVWSVVVVIAVSCGE